ncbi:MAG: crossover junction endodeoxyribonuclease RuvC [Deltaproteobacteria bacterium]|nr:crossover junction endodeoxyribonuclease RuvC [Deltaproteobacteria bacterium]
MTAAGWNRCAKAGKTPPGEGGHTFRVLGIDPGSHVTGYGLVEKTRNGLVWVAQGEIKPKRGATLSACLQTIYEGLRGVIEETKPDAIAIEDIFYGKNVQSLIKQGHVRGVAVLAGRHGAVPIFEYSPTEIKQAIVGYGRAEKAQVQMMAKTILKLAELPPPDAADALAVAICHIHFAKTETI